MKKLTLVRISVCRKNISVFIYPPINSKGDPELSEEALNCIIEETLGFFPRGITISVG